MHHSSALIYLEILTDTLCLQLSVTILEVAYNVIALCKHESLKLRGSQAEFLSG